MGQPASKPFMNIHMQSAVDRTVAPGGMHTISIFTQYFPYTLAEGTWDERREEIADNVIREFAALRAEHAGRHQSAARCWPRPISRPASD